MIATLFLLLACQTNPATGTIYYPGSLGRPGGFLPEPRQEQLLLDLQNRRLSSEQRLQALAILAYQAKPLPFDAVRAMRRYAHGEDQIDYVRCLGLAGEEGLHELKKMKNLRRPEVRAEAIFAQVLHLEEGEDLGRQVLRNRQESYLVRVAALRGLAERGSPFAHVEALRRLLMEEGPLLYECLAILRLEPSQDDILPLIELLELSHGRAAAEAVELLQEITGYRIANDYKTWKHFFLKHKAEGTPFSIPSTNTSTSSTLSYLGIPIYSDRLAFVLDSSGSMKTPLPEQRPQTRGRKSKEEFVKLLPRLPERAKFNVIFFESELHVFSKSLVSASVEQKDKAKTFVQSVPFEGGTNLFGGLSLAFADSEVEEVILLTDGAPSVGEFVDPIPILARIARWNRWRRVRISTISFGAPPRDRYFLYRLAMENLGACRIID